MTLTGLLRILFRWKFAGTWMFLALAGTTLILAKTLPLSYESRSILERKPVKITPVVSKLEDVEFDVYRLTSESQRTVALLKSQYMLERWMGAVGIQPKTPQEKDREISKLYHSLTIQPIAYTDLFVLKVRANSPTEARRRLELLVDQFSQWDQQQGHEEAQQLQTLLQERMRSVNSMLQEQWDTLKAQKSAQSLSLSGSTTAKQLEVGISAQGKLFDTLTTELEEAERQLQRDRLARTRTMTPPSTADKPVLSFGLRVFLGLCASLMAAVGFIFLLEWQDPTVRRTQDIVRELPLYPVMAIPRLNPRRDGPPIASYLGLLADAIAEHGRTKTSTLVQFISPSDGHEKSTLCSILAQTLAREYHICLIRQAALPASTSTPSLPRVAENTIYTVNVDLAEPLTQHLEALRRSFNLFLLDTDSPPHSAPGSDLVQQADLICILVTAGRTTRQYLRSLRNLLSRFPADNFLFILNRFEDPLPPWLLTH